MWYTINDGLSINHISCRVPDCTNVDNGWYGAMTCMSGVMLTCVSLHVMQTVTRLQGVCDTYSLIATSSTFSIALAKIKESKGGAVAIEPTRISMNLEL